MYVGFLTWGAYQSHQKWVGTGFSAMIADDPGEFLVGFPLALFGVPLAVYGIAMLIGWAVSGFGKG